MKKSLSVMMSAACAAGLMGMVNSAHATVGINYNATVIPINGSGNASTGWSVLTDSGNGVQLGFMGQYNYPGYPNNATQPANPSDGSGTYLFPTGNKPGSPTRSQADAWFYVNSGSVNLSASPYNFYLQIQGPNDSGWNPAINLLTAFPDNSYGNNSTPAGGGTVGTASTSATLQGANNIAMNAEDVVWVDPSFDPNAGGTVQFREYAVLQTSGDQSVNAAGADVLNTQILFAPVPEPSTDALVALGALVCGCFIYRSKRPSSKLA